jgi:DNA-binding transcriptional MerR regulator
MTTLTNKFQVPDRLYFRIGDVAELVGVKPYVLRYWESEFPIIHPQKSPSGQRVYRKSDVETVLMIKHLLYEERYSIEGARKRLKELRKDGELKELKEEALSQSLDSSSPVEKMETTGSAPGGATVAIPSEETPTEVRTELRKLAQEIRTLSKTPISKLFQY